MRPNRQNPVTGRHWHGHFPFARGAPLGFLRKGWRLLQPLHNTHNRLLKSGVTAFAVLMVTGLIRVFRAEKQEQAVIGEPGRASVRRCAITSPTDVEMGMTFVQGEGNCMRRGREV